MSGSGLRHAQRILLLNVAQPSMQLANTRLACLFLCVIHRVVGARLEPHLRISVSDWFEIMRAIIDGTYFTGQAHLSFSICNQGQKELAFKGNVALHILKEAAEGPRQCIGFFSLRHLGIVTQQVKYLFSEIFVAPMFET